MAAGGSALALEGLSLSDYALRVMKQASDRPTPAEIRARLEERESR